MDPGGIVEHLSHHVARRAAPLELEDYEVAGPVQGQDVDRMSVGRRDLAAEEEEILADEAQVLADPALQPSFQIQLGGGEPDRTAAVDGPELHLNGHAVEFSYVLPGLRVLFWHIWVSQVKNGTFGRHLAPPQPPPHRFDFRHPFSRASASVQNQASPRAGEMTVES